MSFIFSCKKKNITDFIPYLKECVKLAKRNGKKAFISESTDLGLLVSLKSTVELSTYLIDDIGFDYVMTARFNQDTIEQFFANIRSAMGPNNHPNAKSYAQIHRLQSIYSLVQPPKGSNVSGVENLKSLMSVDDLIAQAEKDRKASINEVLGEIVEMGNFLNCHSNYCERSSLS
ncbi:Transposable element P transposase [Frankliniella fusca]|uniref:Transposable element P transposase n=1 Tax=Frankliniella fusca TaxID=407009 RepID=A0AAE1HRY7_9NEOP|nr:Transposable element P transposase [Frankliniella fusca]